MTIKLFPLDFFGVKMCDKMAISAYILKIVENDPFLKVQTSTKETFNRHQFYSTNKRYIKIKLMQNETNLWRICFGKGPFIYKVIGGGGGEEFFLLETFSS